MFKDTVEKIKDFTTKIGMGLNYKENTHKMKGEFFLTLNHNDGRVEKHHVENIIVDSASLLIARLLADAQTTIDPTGPNHGLRVLAVGTGDPGWDPLNPPPATSAQELLESELSRKRFSSVNFVRTDGSGLPANEITNILDFQCVLSESEAVGPIMELALFGGGTGSENIDTTPNTGTMLNYRTLAVINKPNTATLSIIFRLTT